MPDEQKMQSDPGGLAGSSEPQKAAGDVAKWIKNLGALVTVFAALVGVWVTVYQLRLKFQEDQAAAETKRKDEAKTEADKLDAQKEIARNNRAAEEAKRDAQQAQIDDLIRSRKDQALQHTADIQLELDKHRLDIKQAIDTQTGAQLANNRNRLAMLLTHMFSNASTESDIAELFEFTDTEGTNRTIVENAVLARLENPRSKEEIDLGFRLLEKVGPSALDSVIQTNLSARQQMDACIVQQFYESVIEKSKPFDPYQLPMSLEKIDSAELEVASANSADHGYIYATINQYLKLGARQGNVLPHHEPLGSKCPVVLAYFVIDRSSVALARLAELYSRSQLPNGRLDTSDIHGKPNLIDLQGTFITQKSALKMSYSLRPFLRLYGCYFSQVSGIEDVLSIGSSAGGQPHTYEFSSVYR